MKKVIALAMALAVPGLFFLNAWQGYRYYSLSKDVAGLEKHQKELFEANMGTIAGIAYEQSPQRIEEKAVSMLGLKPLDITRLTRVMIAGGGGEPQ